MSHPKTSETVKDKTGKILFLCTGNYYRSRFAENVFNFEAEKTGLKWHADSRGLNLNLLPPNFQNISPYTAQALKARNIPFDINQRRPLWLREEDLIHSDRVIALDKTEHHPILKKNFPAWVDRVEYWSIHDLDKSPADDALSGIENAVLALIKSLFQAQKNKIKNTK